MLFGTGILTDQVFCTADIAKCQRGDVLFRKLDPVVRLRKLPFRVALQIGRLRPGETSVGGVKIGATVGQTLLLEYLKQYFRLG